MLYAKIAPVPGIPTLDCLTYEVPDELCGGIEAGVRALVPLGRRAVTGLVLELVDRPPEGLRLRAIRSLLDREPVVPGDLLRLARWISEYYLAPLPDVLSLAIGRGLTTTSTRRVRLLDSSAARTPTEKRVVAQLAQADGAVDIDTLRRERGGTSVDRALTSLREHGAVEIVESVPNPAVQTRYETVVAAVSDPDEALQEIVFARAPRRRELFTYLLAQPHRSATVGELAAVFPSAPAQIDALCTAGLVERRRRERYRNPRLDAQADVDVTLTAAQREAVANIAASLGGYQPFLLHGVTASGKTEVYLRAISAALERGSSALVLVPEIPLTHQIVARLLARFGPTVAVLHSELSAGERWDQWRRLARGEARIAVGARSAVLAPLHDLGLVVVDEEHDSAYKQEDGVRYHGRDVAIMRASQAGCPVVLGSATPSLESWHNGARGHYRVLSLPGRVSDRALPSLEVVDLRGRDVAATGGLSSHLARLMQDNLARGGQTLLFLNRRGFASHSFCYECGASIECANCSVTMTLHRHDRVLRCHYCDASQRLPERCPQCNADALDSHGLGTQRVERAVVDLLPRARVERLDRDVTARKGRSAEILRRWRSGDIDVLIGTQMIAKGHDAHGVTLVGVVQADLSLAVPDFRAGERTFQLISQVAGRAGRGERKGRVVVQTYQPEHPAIAAAVRHDYRTFADQELLERDQLGYPPHARMVMLRFESKERAAGEELARRAASYAAAYADRYGGPTVRGPAPAAVERLRGRHRYVLQLRSPSSALVRGAARYASAAVSDQARRRAVRAVIDVDPLDML